MGALRLGLSYWGVCNDFPAHKHVTLDTPDGHRYGRPIFVRALLERGHKVFRMQQRREEFAVPAFNEDCENPEKQFPDLDVLFLEWRWPTWKNDRTHPKHDPSKHEPDLDRQRELIEHYRDRCPIIAWDTDLKITLDDEERWPELILADPSFETNRLSRDRVSLPFWTDWNELIPVSDPYPIYGFIGNNYERPAEFQRYFFSVKQDTRVMGVQTAMYGNWLQKSPERESPVELISTHREVAFNHRMNFYDSMCMMNGFVCTTHVSKPRYYETGFVSPRYLEALAVNCPALTPATFKAGGLLGEKYVVRSGLEVIDAIRSLKDLTLDARANVMKEQRETLQKHGKFNVSRVIDFIESGRRYE